jgi:signal transduction histidine kinase
VCVITNADTPGPHTVEADIVLPEMPAAFVERLLYGEIVARRQQVKHASEQNDVALLKNVLIHNVAHELRTPLLQVKSAVALIAEEDPDGRVHKMAVQATARLEAIIKNITLLSDSLNVTFGPVLIHESIDQAIRNLRRIWIHKYDVSRIVVDIDDDVPPVIGDGQRIGIVLQQLLDNALKFGEDDVYINVTKTEEGVRIAVKDTGIGIAEDQLQQIFQAFYQVDSSITRPYNGIGLGLAIVAMIMEKHNVEVEVQSQLGKGSTFSFILPEASLS